MYFLAPAAELVERYANYSMASAFYDAPSDPWHRSPSFMGTDADVRAGPMPPTFASAGVLNLHAYVDHSLVTVIVSALAASRWPWD